MVYSAGHVADEGDWIVEIWVNALHRKYNYYGNIQSPHYIAWIYDNTDFTTAKKQAFEVFNRKSKDTSIENLNIFFDDRKFIVEMGYHPEFFQTMKF